MTAGDTFSASDRSRNPALDTLMPAWDFRQRHSMDIAAGADAVYAAVRHADLSASASVRLLFGLRGLPPAALSLDGMIEYGFNVLMDQPPQDLVLGIVGQLWMPRPVFERLDAEGFRAFHRPGYVKLVWGFHLEPLGSHLVRLTTETRASPTDGRARLCFLPYWIGIRPFSGWIRRQLLDRVRRDVTRTVA